MFCKFNNILVGKFTEPKGREYADPETIEFINTKDTICFERSDRMVDEDITQKLSER